MNQQDAIVNEFTKESAADQIEFAELSTLAGNVAGLYVSLKVARVPELRQRASAAEYSEFAKPSPVWGLIDVLNSVGSKWTTGIARKLRSRGKELERFLNESDGEFLELIKRPEIRAVFDATGIPDVRWLSM